MHHLEFGQLTNAINEIHAATLKELCIRAVLAKHNLNSSQSFVSCVRQLFIVGRIIESVSLLYKKLYLDFGLLYILPRPHNASFFFTAMH